jgi:RNA polymerase sigma factor (sigma-70 family)
MLGNAADAEDVTQTTFMNAYRAVQSGERPRKPGAWLRTIAHNVCRQRFRTEARRPREVTAFEEEVAGPPLGEQPEGPSAADIKRALQALPFNQRSALVMRELEGRRQGEIAAALGLSESAVEALLFRARRGMREQLEGSITCGEAERAVSRQLDRSLPRAERSRLRAHIRECSECATFARQARAQRGALKSLGAVPLPASLLSWGGGTSAVGGIAVGLKVAAGVAAVAVAVGAGDLGVHYLGGGKQHSDRPAPGASQGKDQAGQQPVAAAAAAVLAHREHAVRRAGHARAAPGSHRRSHHPVPGRQTAAGTTSQTPSHAVPVRAHGTPAQSQGRAVRAHGTPSTSQGRQVRAHGSPAAQNQSAHPQHPAQPSHPTHPAHPPQSHAPPPQALGPTKP